MDVGVTPRRHNPVDSICRKLQTIQRRDQEANSPFQIPKLQSSSYDSPHTGLRRNLEAILKKRGVRGDGDSDHETSSVMLTPTGTPATRLPTRSTPTHSVPFTPANATYSITSTLGTLAERGSMAPGYTRPWQRSCSTPAVQRSGDGFINFTPRCPLPVQPQVEKEKSSAPPHGLLTYNLNFCSSDTSNIGDSELAYPALVVKRLSLGDFTSESKKESMAEVSLICEEDLLDTIFQACDTQCRKVYVSHIVDYLRHTTSRSSEDSGLEELCNMLDPEHKDISIDLDTYHAIMKEWIEDCRNQETSDLVFCVADLQFNNQKLQEEVRKLKQTVEGMEETNQKLIEENEELKTQAKGQQLLQKERMLKEEVEEMKLSLSSSEEIRARASAQSKHMERENQNLIMKISSLQEENLKVSMEVDELQKKMRKLYELNTDLQVQIHSFDAVMAEKVSVIQEKTRQTEELKAAVMEYSSLLRAEKSKLESQMQLMQPDMTPGISLSVAYTLNQTSSGSLETELALAQHHPLEGADNFSSSICLASPLDETLDREVLLLLQGPTPEQMSLEFKALINRLRKEFEEDSLAVITSLRGLTKSQETQDNSSDLKVQDLRVQLQRRRGDWVQGLEQLKQYTDSLEKELLKMASNMRRSRTEILHLSVVQEQENQKQHLREELDQLKTPQDSREASSQTPEDVQQVVEDLDGSSLDWVEKRTLPTSPIREEDPAVLEPKEDQKSERDPDPEGEEIRAFRETDKVEEGVCGEVEKRGLSREREATHDSGVETDELGGSTLLQKGLPDEEARLPECTGPEDTHGQAVCCEASESTSLLHSHTLCAKLTQEQLSDVPSVLDLPVAEEEEAMPEAGQQVASAEKDSTEMSRSMEAIEEQKTQEESEASVTTEKEDVSVVSEDASDSTKDESNLSPSDKEIETEFHRLSLGYKCDMFTLEKRFRLEERSRDLAEENVRREVSSCQGLLQALIPLCEDDNQSMEIIQRLQKNLDILIQSMTRVSSRSEMLGSIHQESRTGKAVEVMIQHVENLRRTYTKEHAELMELRETLMQNERSFGSHTERDFRNKKQPNSQYYKPAPRRVSLGIIPRPLHFDMNKDGTETEAERLSRRSPNVVGKSVQRPPLKRFISSGGWAETDGPALINPNNPSPTEQTPPCLVETRSAVVTRSLWVWLAMLVILAALLALLASLVMQPAVDAAPVGTGDSWMT
uniref:Lymphoid-restricted membrane protein n=1 Tax=Astyanax mexicanus TaxID=7994 RepID=A0A3B1JN90_ASTMX